MDKINWEAVGDFFIILALVGVVVFMFFGVR